jgi:predicted Zn-dependent protease
MTSLIRPTPRASLVLLCTLAACATNPVTGKSELSLISQSQEIQMGHDASAGDLQRVGELNKADAVAMVRRIGTAIAAKSERPSLPWEFHVLDDAAVNAFAYPGGYIFVTRGLMTHLTNEAELAEVIGHEIGHVTAKHTVNAMSKQQVAQIGLVGAQVLSPTVAKYGDLLGTGAGLLFLKFGRDDETQADALGFKYSLAQGYDVREAPKVFNTLARLSGEGGARVPEWQSTHPDPGNRVKVAEQKAAALPAGSLTNAKVNRDGYLKVLDGMVFGENPRLGFFKGANFRHPDMRFQFDFPAGWKTMNMAEAVVGQSADGSAQIEMTAGQGTPVAAVQKFTSQQGITVTQSGSTTINGLPAALATFTAKTSDGTTLNGEVGAVQHNGATFMFLGLMAAQAPSQRASEIDATIRSFRALADAASLNVQPATIQLVTLPTAMTGLQFTQQFPSTAGVNTIYIINEMDATTNLAKGTVLKRVVGGALP